MKLNCIIVDDEPLALELLADNISRIPYLQLQATCRNAMEAISVLQQSPVDLVFSDIQMPGLNGLDMIRSLSNKPMFILITAYQQYALEGFNVDVVDYLLKPIAYDRFLQACNKALELFGLRQRALQPQQAMTEKEYIFLPVDYKMIRIDLEDIEYIEGVKDYVRFHFTHPTQKPLLVRMSMKGIQDMLPATRFVRFHKSYIAQIRWVTAVRKNSLFIKELELPVGEQYKDVVALITGG